MILVFFQHDQPIDYLATCDVENIGSIKVLQSLGFRLEGHFKQNLYVKGQWRDNYLFALLSSEYKENQLTK